jgi:hypothetical protein
MPGVLRKMLRSKWQVVTEFCGKFHNEELRNNTPRRISTSIGQKIQEILDVPVM